MTTQKINSNPQAILVGKEEGDSFWQPKDAGGYLTIKVSPWNVPDTTHTIFLQEIPPGGKVNTHYHEENDEMFICLAGEGKLLIDDETYNFKPEAVAYIRKNTSHSLEAIGDTPLRCMVIISPPGLENRLKQMGRPRLPGDQMPPSFDSNAPSEGHG